MVYRATLSPLFSLRREVDRLFDDTFGRTGTGATAWSPSVDVHEEQDSYVFELEIPGVNPEEVEVTAEGGVLSVSGEKLTERERDTDRWHIVERMNGAFRRTFQLPQNVAEDEIDASFENGLLTVRVPKAEVPQPRKIQIRKSAGEVGGKKPDKGGRQVSSGGEPVPKGQSGTRGESRSMGDEGGSGEPGTMQREKAGAKS